MKKVLVTGGSGFLGSHVADSLSDAGFDITIFDKNPSKWIRPDQKQITGDLLDEKLIKSVVHDFDYIYHFAALADLDECISKPVETVKFNILGTVQLLDALRDKMPERFVYASTAYVFSRSGGFYRASKQAAESYLELYHDIFGLNYTILRFGSLYGPRSDSHNGIFRFLKQAMETGEINYSGTGEEFRQFIHVHDAAKASVDILSDEHANEQLVLTGNDSLKYKDLFTMINEMLGGHIRINLLPIGKNSHYFITPYNFTPKPGKKLVVNPFVDLGQGLLECMNEIYMEKSDHK